MNHLINEKHDYKSNLPMKAGSMEPDISQKSLDIFTLKINMQKEFNPHKSLPQKTTMLTYSRLVF